MRTAILSTLTAALLLAFTLPALAQPKLTILYSGNNHGTLRPCPTWGGKTIGGLARRAGYIKQLKQGTGDPGPLLILAGGHELARPGTETPDTKSLGVLTRCYDTMDYDLGLLTGAEHELFEKAGITPPKAFVAADKATYREFTLADGGKIGVILFPDLPRKSKEPDSRTVKGIEDLVRKHRDEVKLLIGISPWGLWVEQAFMKMKPVGPHIVLGSGIGTELRGVLRDSKGRIFWSRSSVRGRSIARIDVLQWPDGDDFVWTDNESIKSDFTALTEQHPEDVEVLRIILGE